ncbi:hypothetical protein PTSG_08849 [Salpingoeca rosetta]|uniref:Uncharacterized protein n=1 Tax=Salpingoeca rosetta (strain ATCC 50818 / BSB-021) TaxID=946362 RepID=F2UKW1_SALR5|nr:uncharacterized protein PTSG_08849 [Salpingoeca rosetta]EGD77760.1 hypothetical protein PTSG_08849 [Salpingoeca rosetta]|eukprot:XP_004990236.1 hypothetical protein PTSG_08849 [Salpingoeca rosetta]
MPAAQPLQVGATSVSYLWSLILATMGPEDFKSALRVMFTCRALLLELPLRLPMHLFLQPTTHAVALQWNRPLRFRKSNGVPPASEQAQQNQDQGESSSLLQNVGWNRPLFFLYSRLGAWWDPTTVDMDAIVHDTRCATTVNLYLKGSVYQIESTHLRAHRLHFVEEADQQQQQQQRQQQRQQQQQQQRQQLQQQLQQQQQQGHPSTSPNTIDRGATTVDLPPLSSAGDHNSSSSSSVAQAQHDAPSAHTRTSATTSPVVVPARQQRAVMANAAALRSASACQISAILCDVDTTEALCNVAVCNLVSLEAPFDEHTLAALVSLLEQRTGVLNLPPLASLTVRTAATCVHSLCHVSSLFLYLSQCEQLKGLHSIDSVHVMQSPRLQRIADFKRVRTLILHDCPQPPIATHALTGVASTLAQLREAHVHADGGGSTVSMIFRSPVNDNTLQGLCHAHHVQLLDCSFVTRLTSLTWVTSLHVEDLKQDAVIPKFHAATQLVFRNCPHLKRLEAGPRLQRLHVANCPQFEGLPTMCVGVSVVLNNTAVTDFRPIAGVPELSLSNMAHLGGTTTLEARGFTAKWPVKGITELRSSLRKLTLRNLPGASWLETMPHVEVFVAKDYEATGPAYMPQAVRVELEAPAAMLEPLSHSVWTPSHLHVHNTDSSCMKLLGSQAALLFGGAFGGVWDVSSRLGINLETLTMINLHVVLGDVKGVRDLNLSNCLVNTRTKEGQVPVLSELPQQPQQQQHDSQDAGGQHTARSREAAVFFLEEEAKKQAKQQEARSKSKLEMQWRCVAIAVLMALAATVLVTAVATTAAPVTAKLVLHTQMATGPGSDCVAKACSQTCIPSTVQEWGNCCNHTDTCRFDVVFQDYRCIPAGLICS